MTVPDGFSVFSASIPGGSHSFGVACLRGVDVKASTVSTVAEALEWAATACGTCAPAAAGLDTILHWCDGPSGWRPSDWRLRTAYPAMSTSIISPNGLFGSMGIGGMAAAMRLRERWPEVLLNETHPKVLMHALGAERYADKSAADAVRWFSGRSGLALADTASGHELDAVLSAWATREGLRSGWGDLVGNHSSLLFPVGKVSYLWPAFGPDYRKHS